MTAEAAVMGFAPHSYHAVEPFGVEEAARRLDGEMAVAESMAYAAIRALTKDLGEGRRRSG